MATVVFKKDVNVGYLSMNLNTIAATDQNFKAELIILIFHVIAILSGFGSIE